MKSAQRQVAHWKLVNQKKVEVQLLSWGFPRPKGWMKWFLWQEATIRYLLLVYVPRRWLYVINLGYVMVFHIKKQQQPL